MFEFKEEQINHSLWVEKYRPSKLDDYVGNEHLKSKVSGYIENEDVPHLLFFGEILAIRACIIFLLSDTTTVPPNLALALYPLSVLGFVPNFFGSLIFFAGIY